MGRDVTLEGASCNTELFLIFVQLKVEFYEHHFILLRVGVLAKFGDFGFSEHFLFE